MKVAFSRIAQTELFDILIRIFHENPFAARKMRKEFLRKLSLLAFQPGLGTRGEDFETRETFVKGRYRIVYRVEDEVLWIARIIHPARLWPPG